MLKKNAIYFGLSIMALSYTVLSITLPDAIEQSLVPIFDKHGLELIVARTMQVFFISLIAVGVTTDIIGAKRSMIIGTILVLLGNLIFGQSDSLSEALVGRGLIGAGASFVWISIISLYAKNFPKSIFILALAFTIALEELIHIYGNTILTLVLQSSPWRHYLYALCPLGIITAMTCYILLIDFIKDNEQPSRLSDIERIFINSNLWLIGLVLAGGLFAIELFSSPMGIKSLQQLILNHPVSVAKMGNYFQLLSCVGAILVGLITYKVHKYRLLLIVGYGFAAIGLTILCYIENIQTGTMIILFVIIAFFLGSYIINYKFVRNLFRYHSLASAYALITFISFLGVTALSVILKHSLHDLLSNIPIGNMHILVSNDIRTTLTVIPVILVINILMITFIKIKPHDHRIKRLAVPVTIGSELRSYWHGRQPLGRTFWGLHILGSILFGFIIAAILITFNISILPEYFASIKIMILPYSVLTAVCVWRAAERQTLSRSLKNFVRSVVVVDIAGAFSLLALTLV